MNDNREITDYYSDNYYLAADKLYSVNEDLSISESNNKHIKKKLQKELEILKRPISLLVLMIKFYRIVCTINI